MKRKRLLFGGIVLGVLICFIIIIGPMTPLWSRMGLEPVCIQGEWPHLQLVTCNDTRTISPTVTPLTTPDLKNSIRIPVIVDDDGSPDGSIALLYFLSHPGFDVRAVTISNGEAHPDLFADHVMKLLAGLGRPDIPVGAGSPVPLEGDNVFPEPWRRASDKFWNITLPPAVVTRKASPAAQLLVDTINHSPDPVMLLVSGTHTNLAEALRIDPGIKENIRAVYIMGGSVYVEGNIKSDWPEIDNTVAEWNIWVDPVAAKEVFTSGLPLHLVPLDATRKVTWDQSDHTGWVSSNSSGGLLAGELLQWMLDSWSPEGVYIWDLVAAVQATNPTICPEVNLAVEIVTTPGAELGRTIVGQDKPNVAVCLDPDIGQVKSMAAFILNNSR